MRSKLPYMNEYVNTLLDNGVLESSSIDGASIDIVASELKRYCAAWNPDARIIGNIRAEDIIRLCNVVVRDTKIDNIVE